MRQGFADWIVRQMADETDLARAVSRHLFGSDDQLQRCSLPD